MEEEGQTLEDFLLLDNVVEDVLAPEEVGRRVVVLSHAVQLQLVEANGLRDFVLFLRTSSDLDVQDVDGLVAVGEILQQHEPVVAVLLLVPGLQMLEPDEHGFVGSGVGVDDGGLFVEDQFAAVLGEVVEDGVAGISHVLGVDLEEEGVFFGDVSFEDGGFVGGEEFGGLAADLFAVEDEVVVWGVGLLVWLWVHVGVCCLI